VSSAGGRRGAQMGTFDVGHPDVMEFIRAKREDGRLRQFNLSLLITDEFMHAVATTSDWPLAFPLVAQGSSTNRASTSTIRQAGGLARVAGHDNYVTNDERPGGLPIYKTCRRGACGT
jgi:ribonucleoside-diphosphate reductase alpha chain